jgi:cellulose synthase/poly-beta-1,6-N-acetylglucosamine synthase-like glycosyltransferase
VPDKTSLLYTFCAYFRLTLILPIFVAIRVLSTLWFADVANAAFAYSGSSSPSSSIDFSRAASDFLHSILVELVFLFIALLLTSVPYAGKIMSLGKDLTILLDDSNSFSLHVIAPFAVQFRIHVDVARNIDEQASAIH